MDESTSDKRTYRERFQLCGFEKHLATFYARRHSQTAHCVAIQIESNLPAPLICQMPITKQPHQSTFTNSVILYNQPTGYDQNRRLILFPFTIGWA
jgi:hypothetical protein